MNYKHLHYFLQVAKTGSVARASEQLHLTPQTLSGQIAQLEQALGSPLFVKSGRGLALSQAGRLALGYAEDIFLLGAELQRVLRDDANSDRLLQFRVGVTDAVVKSIAYRLIEPATRLAQPVHIVCKESKFDSLLAELALHRLDLVLSDAPIPTGLSVRAYNHRLGSSGVAFFGDAQLQRQFAEGFPASLEGAPLLLPGEDSALGPRLRGWLKGRNLHPRIVGEFDDSALSHEFGRRGSGLFVGPSVLARQIEKQFEVVLIGLADGIEDEFFAISVQRRISHPCVAAITESARRDLFATDDACGQPAG